jgi:hypothetical protein
MLYLSSNLIFNIQRWCSVSPHLLQVVSLQKTIECTVWSHGVVTSHQIHHGQLLSFTSERPATVTCKNARVYPQTRQNCNSWELDLKTHWNILSWVTPLQHPHHNGTEIVAGQGQDAVMGITGNLQLATARHTSLCIDGTSLPIPEPDLISISQLPFSLLLFLNPLTTEVLLHHM